MYVCINFITVHIRQFYSCIFNLLTALVMTTTLITAYYLLLRVGYNNKPRKGTLSLDGLFTLSKMENS